MRSNLGIISGLGIICGRGSFAACLRRYSPLEIIVVSSMYCGLYRTKMAEWCAVQKKLHEKELVRFKEINYCPETVVVHTAFLLADREAVRGLNELEKGKCSKAIQIVSEAIREITQKSPLDEKNNVHQVKATELEFKIHSWVFSSLFRKYGGLEVGESPEEDYLDSFPPLPQIGVNFYLGLVQEEGWNKLLVEVCNLKSSETIFVQSLYVYTNFQCKMLLVNVLVLVNRGKFI